MSAVGSQQGVAVQDKKSALPCDLYFCQCSGMFNQFTLHLALIELRALQCYVEIDLEYVVEAMEHFRLGERKAS